MSLSSRSLTTAALLALVAPPLLAAQTPGAGRSAPPAGEVGPLAWYLPGDVAYDPALPEPAEVLGYPVGAWHVRHDQLVQYFRTVAAASPRVRLETYARSHEDRPLLLAAVSSPENLERLEELRTAHVEAVLSGAEEDEGPLVVWMGYSVHGNEPSGSNASLLFLYHLAAAQGEEVEALLRDTVVLIDPALNPDGLARFAQWANMHRGVELVGDPAHREHREVWPGGRTNHYWFDLNRDWLLGTHPESRGRLERFHAWMPSVLTDFHEMGSESTYFFQPGIPSRRNPLTPERNVELTQKIAEYHAAALDAIGSLYYTEESFDDFYYGKGSTYPDIHGAVGILFEQASSRGHYRENSYGGIDFQFTIRNQLRTSLSTLRAADELREELSGWQRRFYADALTEAAAHPVAAYVFGAPEDPGRTFRLVELLRLHGVRVHRLGRELGPAPDDGEGFAPESAYVVPLEQPQFRLIRALFERRTSWPDNTFYDVSAWTLPLSFGVPVRAIDRDGWSRDLLAAEVGAGDAPAGSLQQPAEDAQAVAWVFEWHHHASPRALDRLLDEGLRPRVATKRFRARTAAGPRDFDYGTIVVPTGIQDVEPEKLRAALEDVAALGLDVYAATSGLTPEGVDLGSGSLRAVEPPAPLLLVGGGVSSYEAGEAWHYLDQRVGVPLAMVERDDLAGLDLGRYTHLILVNGATRGWADEEASLLRGWVSDGGVLIAQKGSAVWTAERLLDNVDEEPDEDEAEETPAAPAGDEEAPAAPEDGDEQGDQDAQPAPSYEDYEDLRAQQRVAGTIFGAHLDRTHPLLFGYARDTLAVFRNFEELLPEGEDPFATPLRYRAGPPLAGFASAENVERISGTPAARAERIGEGTVVCLIDDPNFRGVWYGTSKLFANALFFGAAIKRTGPLEPGR